MLGRIAVVMASRVELDYAYSRVNRTSPFQNRLQLQSLGLLEHEAAEQLIHFSDELLTAADQEIMRQWAGCHPFYLQLLGFHLVFSKKSGESQDLALNRFRAESAARLRELWHVLDERDRNELRAIVAGEKPKRPNLRDLGLLTDDGSPFGRVLFEWIKEQS
jgi:hypothetical protein